MRITTNSPQYLSECQALTRYLIRFRWSQIWLLNIIRVEPLVGFFGRKTIFEWVKEGGTMVPVFFFKVWLLILFDWSD